MNTVRINGKEIGGHETYIIGEMAWSHDGDIEKAKTIMKGVAESGDAICIHITSMPDYMVPYYGSGKGIVSAGKEDLKVYNYLCDINISNDDWKKIVDESHSLGLAVIPMPNDIPSLRFINEAGADGFILSPACMDDEALVKEMASFKKPIFIRIGGATIGEINDTVNLIHSAGNHDIVLIHGFQSYPTPLEEMNLGYIETLKKMFDVPVGFADHIDGDDEWAWKVPVMAVVSGADVIEKHVTYDRSAKGEDFESAFNPDEFTKLCGDIKKAKSSIGCKTLRPLTPGEERYRKIVRKRCIAARDIPKGDVFKPEDITFMRSDIGAFVDEAKFIIGREAAIDIGKGDAITFEKTGVKKT